LQDIASANGGNRAAGTPGYDHSVAYVAERLRAAGYAVRLEEFEFPFFEERTPPVLVTGTADAQPASASAVRTLSNSGSGDVTARLRAVSLKLGEGPPGASTSGCEAADFQVRARRGGAGAPRNLHSSQGRARGRGWRHRRRHHE
jgi:aminopeptidase Y